MRKPWLAFLSAFVLPLSLMAADPVPVKPFHLDPPQIETLPNGLQVVWFTNDKLPVVDLVLVVKSGFRDDPAGKSGTSEFLAATLDRGAGGLSAQALAKSVEMLGASRYVSADEDTFSVGMHGLAPDAETLLGALARMVLQPDFPVEEVTREHGRLLDRWSHLGDYGETLASLAFHRALASGTPYGRGNFLSVKEFSKVGRADVMAFHKQHFTPKNAVLMIVGRVEQEKFKKKVSGLFGGWTGEAPVRSAKSFSDTRIRVKPGEILLVDRPGLNQAQVRMGFRAPPLRSPDSYPLAVANALLGEYFNSRLTSIIRDKLGLTYSIGSGFSYAKDFAKFTVSSSSRNETVGQLIDKTISILDDLKKGAVSEQEVTEAKEYLMGGFPLGVATLSAVASRWLNGWLFALGPEYLNEFVPRVSQVDRKAVLAALSSRMDLKNLHIVIAGDAKELEKHLSAAQKKKLKRAKVKDLM